MKFRRAVENTEEIRHYLLNQLDALSKAHKSSVTPSDPKRVTGSVDLDAALQPLFPNATRWDYAIGYRLTARDDKAFFVEFHRAFDDQVKRVIEKKHWLESWMDGKALDELREREFVWVSAGGIHIPGNAPSRRELDENAIRLERRLTLK